MIKRFIPHRVKVLIRLMERRIHDVFRGHTFQYAKQRQGEDHLSNALTIEQDLKPNEAKKKNLLLAINRIQSIQVNPNEIFSFWKIVGSPSQRRGFVESRSLINDKLEVSVGGGLCQLSGLIYFMSLHANLEILERHNHSADIYTEETRFTPLGSDATVAYGYKDLKIRNTLDGPIRFNFSLNENSIAIHLMHDRLIQSNNVEFVQCFADEHIIEVLTIINQDEVCKSKYRRYVPLVG